MKPETCKGCPLYEKPGPIWGTGSPNATLVVLGQNPGPEEIKENRPFCGTSGHILDRALGDAGISRQSNYVTNVVKCFVAPGSPVPRGAAEKCKPLLERELQSLQKATTILTLGAEAFDEIARPKKFHMLHDRRISRSQPTYWLRGCPLRLDRSGRHYVVIPTLHPSFVARTGFIVAPVMEADVAKAGRFAARTSVWRTPSYNYDPSTKEVEEYIGLILRNAEGGIDIETPESAREEDELAGEGFLPVGLIGLSAYRDHAIGIRPDRFELLRPLFDRKARRTFGLSEELQPDLWAYNAGFDFHHLRQLYVLDAIRQADAMMAFHLLRPEMARKDLGTCMSFYTDLPFHKNTMDSDPDGYNAADTYGVLECGQNMLKEMRALDAVQERRFRWSGQTLESLFWNNMMPIIPIIGEWSYRGAPYDVAKSERMELELALTLRKYEEWWSKSIPLYSWSSPKQLISLFEAMKIKVPEVPRPARKLKDGTVKPAYRSKSVDDDFLADLEKMGNQTAKLVRTMRELRHAGDFLGMHDPATNRVTCRAKPHGQVGGRIQTVNYNWQTVPEEIAGKTPRDCVIPENKELDVVISVDFSQAEFWIYSWYSKCKRALEIKANGDYLYGAFYEDIWDEPFFLPNVPRTKDNRDEAQTPAWKLLIAKSWPLGFIYGRGAPDPKTQGLPIDSAKAKRIHSGFHADYPEFSVFHHELVTTATRYRCLQTVFGRLRRFPNPTGQRNEILAFPGQTTLVDVLIKNALIPIGQQIRARFGERSRTYFTVHDSLVSNVNCEREGRFSVTKALEAYEWIKACCETPIPEMDGFIIPASVKIGPSWGQGMSKEKFLALHASATV